jgi:hypothetical protein
LLVHHQGKRWGFEFKYQDAPKLTKSLRTAMTDLKLERAWIVYPGTSVYPVADRVECVGLGDLDRVRQQMG